MAKEKSAPPYVFHGMTPFVEQVAKDMGLDAHQMGRAQSGWHQSRLQQLLGQLPKLDPDSQQTMLDEQIYPVHESHEAAVEAERAAIQHVLTGCGIAAPKRQKPADKKVAIGHAQR